MALVAASPAGAFLPNGALLPIALAAFKARKHHLQSIVRRHSHMFKAGRPLGDVWLSPGSAPRRASRLCLAADAHHEAHQLRGTHSRECRRLAHSSVDTIRLRSTLAQAACWPLTASPALLLPAQQVQATPQSQPSSQLHNTAQRIWISWGRAVL